MKTHEYTSVLKDEMLGFLKMRGNQGFKDSNRFVLTSLDKYLTSQNITEKPLSAKVVDAWLANACNGLSAQSINSYTSYFGAFAKYLLMFGIESFTPEYVRVRESYIPYIFTETEINNIFTAADNIDLNRHSDFITSQVQFSMLLRLLYGCGLRLGEALTLKKSDIYSANAVLFIHGAKGNRDRFVPMKSTLASMLIPYTDYLLRNKPADAWVFESDENRHAGKPRGNDWARKHFRKILSKAGIDLPELPPKQRNICLHCFRHTFIVRSFRKQDIAGINNYDPAASLSVYVGHAKLTGTQRYVHMTAENSIDIINATTEYSKGMFPPLPIEADNIYENETLEITRAHEVEINFCSKGMFPEVPR